MGRMAEKGKMKNAVYNRKCQAFSERSAANRQNSSWPAREQKHAGSLARGYLPFKRGGRAVGSSGAAVYATVAAAI